MKRLFRIIMDIWIALFILLFLSGLLYFITGSLEISPTGEQQDKARAAAVVFMLFSAFWGAICVAIRMKLRKK